jgi:urease accessory protein
LAPTDTLLASASAFYNGLVHPLFVPAHVLALTITGVLVGQQHRFSWIAPAFLLGGLLLGFSVIIRAFAPTYGNELLLAAAATGGVLVALGRAPPALVCVQAVVAGGAVALDSPPQVAAMREALAIILGTLCGAMLIELVTTSLTCMLCHVWQRMALRIAGSWTAAGALLALAHALFK